MEDIVNAVFRARISFLLYIVNIRFLNGRYFNSCTLAGIYIAVTRIRDEGKYQKLIKSTLLR